MHYERCLVKIGNPMTIDLLVVPIGVSRVLSLSMVIDSIYKLNNVLCQDQIVELCFVCTFQNSQLLMDACLVDMAENKAQVYEKNSHPFYGWYETTHRLFDAYQGGNFPRFSCGSNGFIDIFQGKTTNEVTSTRLTNVVQVLYEWIRYINGNHGKVFAHEIPYFEVLNKMKAIVKKVKDVSDTSLEFSMFRLSVFTTLICGLGIVDCGPHLHQFILICENTAAFDHLTNPEMCGIDDDCATACIMNSSSIGNPPSARMIDDLDFDSTMNVLSSEIGHRIYRRSSIEILLCESRPGRVLQLKDVFKRDQSIFCINDSGIPEMKPYGYHGPWIPIRCINNKLKYVN